MKAVNRLELFDTEKMEQTHPHQRCGSNPDRHLGRVSLSAFVSSIVHAQHGASSPRGSDGSKRHMDT